MLLNQPLALQHHFIRLELVDSQHQRQQFALLIRVDARRQFLKKRAVFFLNWGFWELWIWRSRFRPTCYRSSIYIVLTNAIRTHAINFYTGDLLFLFSQFLNLILFDIMIKIIRVTKVLLRPPVQRCVSDISRVLSPRRCASRCIFPALSWFLLVLSTLAVRLHHLPDRPLRDLSGHWNIVFIVSTQFIAN